MCSRLWGERVVLCRAVFRRVMADVVGYSAQIIRTPTEAAWDAPDSHISIARKLQKETPNSHILDQYNNPANPLAHYEGTASELLQQLNGRIDMVVAGAGTGGTITGLSARLKEHNPDVRVVGVDPVGSVLALPDALNNEGRLGAYQVEGIGYDFVPGVLDRARVDAWVKSNDRESLVMMRRLIRHEGLLCGGSSGAAVSAALEAAASLGKGQNCVVVLPDSVRNYMTKALSDEWMIGHEFVDNDIIKKKQYESWWATKRVCDLELNTPLTISSCVRCKDAIALLKREGFDMVPVLDENGDIMGVVTEGNMTRMIISGRAQPNATVADAGVLYKTFRKLNLHVDLATLANALDIEPYGKLTAAANFGFCFGLHPSHLCSSSNPSIVSCSSTCDVLLCLHRLPDALLFSCPSLSYGRIITEQRCFAGHKKKRTASIDSERVGATSAEVGDEPMEVINKSVVSGIVTRIDLLEYISNNIVAERLADEV